MRRSNKKVQNRDDTFIRLTAVQMTAAVLVFLCVFLLAKKDPSLAYRFRTEFEELMREDWDIAGKIKENCASVFSGNAGSTDGTDEGWTQEARGAFAATLADTGARVPAPGTDGLCLTFYGNDAPVLPVDGPVTSDYGPRIHPIDGGESFHSGRDIAADEGTGIRAALDGTVLAVGVGESSGNYIKLDHGDGLVTLYCHCSETYAEEGDIIRKGDIIAAVGQTGAATGPHLHFEVHRDSGLEDPAVLLDIADDVY